MTHLIPPIYIDRFQDKLMINTIIIMIQYLINIL